jgi:hypothetical protein
MIPDLCLIDHQSNVISAATEDIKIYKKKIGLLRAKIATYLYEIFKPSMLHDSKLINENTNLVV